MRFVFALFLTMLFLSSCQRETPFQAITGTLPDSTGTPPPDTTSVLLTKLSDNASGSSSTHVFEYDSAHRLIYEGPPDTSRLQQSRYFFIRYSYDSKGRISTSTNIEHSIKDNQVRYDTAYRFITYVNENSNGIASIRTVTSSNNGDVITNPVVYYVDSAVYTYDNGTIVKTAHFNYAVGAPAPSQAGFLETWDYDANGNMTRLRWYTLDAASKNYAPNFEYQFQYDDKINPMRFGEAWLETAWSATSPNNIVQQKNIYPDGRTEVLTTSYTYRSDDRPASAIFDGRTTFYFY